MARLMHCVRAMRFLDLSFLAAALMACGADSFTEDASIAANDARAPNGDDARVADGAIRDAAITADAAVDASLSDASPFAPLPADEEWHWVPVAGARCADGSATGIGVNRTAKSNKLVIYLEGGGYCSTWNECHGLFPSARNLDGFGPSEFAAAMAASYDGQSDGSRGIFDRTAMAHGGPANPYWDYTFVYVPYCTGDTHRGAMDTVASPITGMFHAGYANVGRDLQLLRAYFGVPAKVVLQGSSAGAFGVLWNARQVRDTFPGVPASFIMESAAPIFDSPGSLYHKRQEQWQRAWGLTETNPAGPTASTHDFDVFRWLVTSYTDAKIGLIASVGYPLGGGDGILALYTVASDIWGFNLLNAGLRDLRDYHLPTSKYPNVAYYFVRYNQHGYVHNSHIESTSYAPSDFPDPLHGRGFPQAGDEDLKGDSLVNWLLDRQP